MHLRNASALAATLAATSLALDARAQAASDPFEVLEIPSVGRTVAAELADLDGDGQTDLLQVLFDGVPPNETRKVAAWLKASDGRMPAKPSYVVPMPDDSAAYDVGDASELPGLELVLLRPNGVTVLSFSNPGLPRRDLEIGGATLAPSEDERGLDRLRMVYPEFGPEPWIFVPLLGEAAFLARDGTVRARLAVGARANYFMPPRPGPLLVDSDVQLLLDVPRVSVADVNGDGAADVVSSSRHDLRVFLRKPDGSFAAKADKIVPLGLVSQRDHIRGTGQVAVEARDVSGDRRADLLISHLTGGLTDSKSSTHVYLNRAGNWDLTKPDFAFGAADGWGSDQLLDIDGDGRPELLHISIPFSVLELVETLVTRSLDAEITVYRATAGGVFAKAPWFTRKIDIPLSFETGRPLGFVPTGAYDVNGDGMNDVLAPVDATEIDVYLGNREGVASSRAARQAVASEGRLRGADWNGDGLTDLLIYDPRELNGAVRIATNRGILPGSPPRMSAPPANVGSQ